MVNTLQPFIPSEEKPWNHRRVQHLYQRLGYGTHLDTLSLDLSPSELVDQLIDGVLQMPAPEPPYWAFWTNEEYPDEDTYFEVKDPVFSPVVSRSRYSGAGNS